MTTDRRTFLEYTAGLGVAAAGLSACANTGAGRTSVRPFPSSGYAAGFRTAPMPVVRIGMVGVGGMGTVHLENLLAIEGVEIRAICDIVPEKVTAAQEKVMKAGQPRPTGYSRGELDFQRMIDSEELDLVYSATPWEWHVPACLYAMENGKHAITEVPAAYTVEDCWKLVETAERQQKHCIMMENCCYDRLEMLMLHLTRLGMLGELLHAECGYLHDLRELEFSKEGEGLWRRFHAMERNGNLYPTHGLGPIAQCLGINRGNQFGFLVSVSSKSRGMELYASEHFPAGDPRRAERFVLGDVNVSLIRTVNGESIYLTHNVHSPRPYSRDLMLQGTRGLVEGWPSRVHIEGTSKAHTWDDASKWYETHEHPFWKSEQVKQASRGHGGMDFLEDYRLISCLRAGEPTDMDVYDAAAWSVMGPLSERSVASGGRPQDVPDFTRGGWKSRQPLGIIE